MSNKYKVGFLQITSIELEPFFKYVRKLNQLYCEKHGYDYIEHVVPKEPQFKEVEVLGTKHALKWSATWLKLEAITKYIDDYDILFFLDADAAVVGQIHTKLEDFLIEGKDIFMCHGNAGGRPITDRNVNGGAILLGPLTSESRSYYKTLFNKTFFQLGAFLEISQDFWHEQTVFNILMNEPLKITSDAQGSLYARSHVYKGDVFNGCRPGVHTSKFINHKMKKPTEVRATFFKESLELIEGNYHAK